MGAFSTNPLLFMQHQVSILGIQLRTGLCNINISLIVYTYMNTVVGRDLPLNSLHHSTVINITSFKISRYIVTGRRIDPIWTILNDIHLCPKTRQCTKFL